LSDFLLEIKQHCQALKLHTMAAEAQAKQLDSVTDHVEEQEVDVKKAQQAMSALMTKQDSGLTAAEQVAVSDEDVALIVNELEVTNEVAERTLREVAVEVKEGDSLVVAALRKLVTS
jgi:ABC-type uncharacterized transport system ATPase subunit